MRPCVHPCVSVKYDIDHLNRSLYFEQLLTFLAVLFHGINVTFICLDLYTALIPTVTLILTQMRTIRFRPNRSHNHPFECCANPSLACCVGNRLVFGDQAHQRFGFLASCHLQQNAETSVAPKSPGNASSVALQNKIISYSLNRLESEVLIVDNYKSST